MLMTDALLGEHGVFYALFDHLERCIPEVESADQLKSLSALLGAALATHAGLENDELFLALDPHMGGGGPLEVMRQEHDDIEGSLSRIPEIDDLDELKRTLTHTIGLARDHFKKEENVLFPMAKTALGDSGLASLGETWAQKRGVDLVG